jgi:hypothetical protein
MQVPFNFALPYMMCCAVDLVTPVRCTKRCYTVVCSLCGTRSYTLIYMVKFVIGLSVYFEIMHDVKCTLECRPYNKAKHNQLPAIKHTNLTLNSVQE